VKENQRGGHLGNGGRVCGARAWTGETNGARGRKIQPAGGGSVLKERGGEGWRGGCRVEAERERERERRRP
jgi:hypothetical protein